MRPQLIASAFVVPDAQGRYQRMARVLQHTARVHCPGWDVRIDTRLPAAMASALAIRSHVFNTQKMERWHRAVLEAPIGARLLLIDVDTFILRPLEDIWDRPFDLAYTTKDHVFPFNTGVVFVRVSDRVRAFVQAWRDTNVRLLSDAEEHRPWRERFGGINQAALGHTLESPIARTIDLCELPCLEWNCEDSAWAAFDPAITRIVHVKSALRRAVFGLAGPMVARERKLQPLVHRWHALERQAFEAEARV